MVKIDELDDEARDETWADAPADRSALTRTE